MHASFGSVVRQEKNHDYDRHWADRVSFSPPAMLLTAALLLTADLVVSVVFAPKKTAPKVFFFLSPWRRAASPPYHPGSCARTYALRSTRFALISGERRSR